MKIIKADNVLHIYEEDESFHILPSGFKDKWLIVDTGPHFNGKTIYASGEEIKRRFGVTAINFFDFTGSITLSND